MAGRLRWAAVGGMLLAALLLQVAESRPWYRAATRTWTGNDLAGGLLGALALALAALVLLLLVVGRWGRVVAGTLTIVIGVIGLVGTLDSRTPSAEQLAQAGVAVGEGSASGGAWWAVVGAAVAALAGAVLASTAHLWPARRHRSETSTRAPDAQADPWKAMDAGLDPTAETPSRDAETPDVERDQTSSATR